MTDVDFDNHVLYSPDFNWYCIHGISWGQSAKNYLVSRQRKYDLPPADAIANQREFISILSSNPPDNWVTLGVENSNKVLEITESRVSQIHTKAILHLRTKLKIFREE